MPDYAARATDEAIRSLERRIRDIYSEAQRDIEKKTRDFWERHRAKDAMYRQQLEDGKITEADYQAWLRGQVFRGKQWDAKMEQIEQTLVNANRQALNIVNGERVQVFATNSNWQAYQIEHDTGVNFGFGIYDADTVTRLLLDEPDLLPPKRLNTRKDKAWNKANVNRQISQGIIQGEGLDKIARRLRDVTDMNRNQSYTNARTMMTNAQNAGRQESYQRAKGMGIKVKKKWLATLDGHTRRNHRRLDGQVVDVDKPFKVGGYSIMYPGDRSARPEMVYNCRCTMISEIESYPNLGGRYDNIAGKPIKNMTYSQWVNAKSSSRSTVGLSAEYTGPKGIVQFNRKLMEVSKSVFGSSAAVEDNIRASYNQQFRSVRSLHERDPESYPEVSWKEYSAMSYSDQVSSFPSFDSFRDHCLEDEPWKFAEKGSLVDGFNRYNLGATDGGYGKGKSKRLEFDQEFGLSEFIDSHPEVQYSGETIYRGIKSNKSGISALQKAFKNGDTINMRGPSSWSTEKRIADSFTKYSLRGSSKSTPVVFVDEGNYRRRAIPFPYSSTGIEPQYEVLYSGNAKFRIINIEERSGVYYVTVRPER